MDNIFIIQSSKKGEKNWNGKEFSDGPAKIYYSYKAVHEALSAYWFVDGNAEDTRAISIIPLPKDKAARILANREIAIRI